MDNFFENYKKESFLVEDYIDRNFYLKLSLFFVFLFTVAYFIFNKISFPVLGFAIILFILNFIKSNKLILIQAFWLRMGNWLGERITFPILIFFTFYFVLCPYSLVLSIFRNDHMKIRDKLSSWKKPDEQSISFENQY